MDKSNNIMPKKLTVLLVLTIIAEARIEKFEMSRCGEKKLPQKLHLKWTTGELNLRRDDQVLAATEVADHGRLKKWKERHNEAFGVYSEAASAASFSVVLTPKTIMYGSFSHGGEFYLVRPIPRHYQARHRFLYQFQQSPLKKISICGSTHLIERQPFMQGPSDAFDDVVIDRLKLFNNHQAIASRAEQSNNDYHYIMTEQQFKLLKKPHLSKSSKQLTVELYVVLDYSIYRQWLELHRSSERAIKDLRYYYAHIVNGMSKRYEVMNITGYRVSVSIAGYYIAKTRKDAPFSDSPKVRINSTTIDVYRALDFFFEWVRERVIEQSPSLPRFDAAMLFTRQILAVKNNETNQIRTISGLADIGALCQVNSVSIVKDFGVHGTMDTATHELAHNLGANHDGSGNDCLSSMQYIMSLAPKKVADYMYNNTLSFSNCSKVDFAKQIAKLNKAEKNCMLDGWGSDEKVSVTSMLEHFPGRNYSLDQQCRLIFGRESFFCGGGGKLVKDLCKEMFCYRPKSRGCKTDVQLKAADGTSCDNKAWCQGGHCTTSEAAPEFNNFCPFGDFKDKIPLYGSGFIYCKHLPQKDLTLCYNQFYRELCCDTCAMLNTKIPGCEYGDRNVSKCSRIKASQCYNEGTREECCRSCELKKTKKPPLDCPYGDRAEWCKNTSIFNSFNCYTSQDKYVCCDTCVKYKTGPEGCEYGDRGDMCKRENCVDTSYWLYCCHACAAFINADEFKRMVAFHASTPSPSTEVVASTDLKCMKDKANWCMTLKPAQCYNAQDTCCRKCSLYYRANKPGCEYGDKSYECDGSNCVGEKYIDSCCDTCSSFFKPKTTTSTTTKLHTESANKTSNKVSTEQTTKSSSSSTTMPSSVKDKNAKRVIKKIQVENPSIKNEPESTKPENPADSLKTATTTTLPNSTQTTFVYSIACPKGDRAAWCKGIKSSQCYKSQEVCCKSCAQFFNPSIQGCEYGDKASWCENHVSRNARDCNRETSSVASNCCHSCVHAKQATEEMEERRDDRGVEWLCRAGDQASYCATIRHAHSCYSYQNICCAACTRFIDRTVPDCPFGDRVSWCARYRNDEKSCRRSDISRQCCKTCASFVYKGKIPQSRLCKDQASWCLRIKPSQCYHSTAITTCCASCHNFSDGKEGDCRYGDKLSWCEPKFCKTHARECCKTCS